jgi:hypothetical protein
MSSITFEAVVRGNGVEIPNEYREKISSPVFVTIPDRKYPGRLTPPRIIARRGKGPITEKSFAPFINTDGWKFNRDEANER